MTPVAAGRQNLVMRCLVFAIAIVVAVGACGGKKDEASCKAVATRLFTLAHEW